MQCKAALFGVLFVTAVEILAISIRNNIPDNGYKFQKQGAGSISYPNTWMTPHASCATKS